VRVSARAPASRAARAHWRASNAVGLNRAGSSRPSPHSRSVKVLTPKWRNSATSSRCQESCAGDGRGRSCSALGSRATLPPSAVASVVAKARRVRGIALARRYRRDEQRQRLLQTLRADGRATVVSLSHHYEIMGWNDQGELATRTGYEVGVPRNGPGAVPVDPEEPAVDWPTIGCPCRSHGADEPHEPLRQNALAVPDAVLEVEIPEPRPVARRGEVVSLREEVAVRVGLDHHRAHSQLVEQRSPREREVVLTTLLDGESDQVIHQHGIGVAIAADGARRPLERAGRGVMEGVDAAGIEVQVIGIRARWIVVRILRRANAQAARHVEEVRDANL